MQFMKTFLFFAAALLVNNNCASASNLRNSRNLALQLIAGFEVSSDVSDVSELDLDQKALVDLSSNFTAGAFANAKKVYTEGGNSESYATLTLTVPLAFTVSIGTVILGVNDASVLVAGVAYEEAVAGSTTLKFKYAIEADILPCSVGGLQKSNTTGCLAASGTLTVGLQTNIAYSYSVATGNKNGRTLQKLSTSANVEMRVNGSINNTFYADFQKFVDYYGAVDYADKLAIAALDGTSVTLSGKVFDFVSYGFEARSEVVTKTTNFMTVAMSVLGQLEAALDNCNATQNSNALKALDEAVALYTGSLEGSLGGSAGVFIYNQARRSCADAKTCGSSGSQIEGNAKVNIDIYFNFTQMKSNLANGSCEAARRAKEDIAKKIVIPFIQGAIRSAYLQSSSALNQTQKIEAEGSIFAAAVLPIVAKCNASAAAVIYEELKPNSGNSANFAAVKFALESSFACMGIACVDVGGLYDSGKAEFFAGAGPCDDARVEPPTAAPRRGFFQRIFGFIANIFDFLNPF